MKNLKNIALIIGGLAVGFVCGGMFVFMKALEFEDIRNGLTNVISKKITTVLFGKNASKDPSYAFSSEDMVFESRKAAEKALERLDEVVTEYGYATICDLIDIADGDAMGNYHRNYIDNKYGWTDVKETEVARVKNGYILKLPACTPIL